VTQVTPCPVKDGAGTVTVQLFPLAGFTEAIPIAVILTLEAGSKILLVAGPTVSRLPLRLSVGVMLVVALPLLSTPEPALNTGAGTLMSKLFVPTGCTAAIPVVAVIPVVGTCTLKMVPLVGVTCS